MTTSSDRLAAAGAGDGDRTHIASLEGWSSAIELHPHIAHRFDPLLLPDFIADPAIPAATESLVEGVGFEPTKTYVGRFTVCCL
jgi:hypothetical protein